MIDEPYPKFELLCRLCLQPNVATVNIFPNKSVADAELSIPVRIMSCAALEVLPSDSLPKCICTECRYQLEKSYYFRKRCQLSDNKLRRHLRLISLGKVSRIFSTTPDEDFDDEMEFEDSLVFLKKKDAERKKEEDEKNDCWKEWTREVLKDEVIRSYREQIKNTFEIDIRGELIDDVVDELRTNMQERIRRSLRQEVLLEVKAEVRNEVIQDVREGLMGEVRNECIQMAKEELRAEVKTECREEARENLLEELNDFLSCQRSKKQKNTEADEQFGDLLNDTLSMSKISSNKHNVVELETSSFEQASSTQSLLINNRDKELNLEVQPRTISTDNEMSASEQAISFEEVSSDNDEEKEDDGAASNFYILEDAPDNSETTVPEIGHGENGFFSYKNQVNFQITQSTSSDNGKTTYQIEENRKNFKKETPMEVENNEEADIEDDETSDVHKSVLIFDSDMEQSVEFIGFDKDSLLDSKPKPELVDESIKRTFVSTENGTNIDTNGSIMLRSNDVTKTFRCADCPRAFTTETSLLRHMSIHQVLEKKGVNHQCPDCRIILSCKSALKRHMVKHTGRRPYVCEECGKAFIQREILKRHLLTHTGVRPYDCPHCDRSFSQKLNLTQHINKSHTDNPKVQQYACHMCPKRFNHASGLSRHLATHNGVIFQCTKCERTFADRSSVKRHIVHVHGVGKTEQTQPTSTNDDDLEDIK